MIIVNRIGDSITGSYNGKPFGVAFSEEKYATMKEVESKAAAVTTTEELKELVAAFELLTKENYKELVEHSKGGKYLWVNNHTGKVFLTINGKVSKQPIPKSLVDRIVTSLEKNIDITPLVKNWARFLRSHLYTTTKAANYAEYINTTVVNGELKAKLMEEGGLASEVAEQRATMHDISFTQEGLLATYKVVNEIDWKYVPDASTENGVYRFENLH